MVLELMAIQTQTWLEVRRIKTLEQKRSRKSGSVNTNQRMEVILYKFDFEFKDGDVGCIGEFCSSACMGKVKWNYCFG